MPKKIFLVLIILAGLFFVAKSARATTYFLDDLTVSGTTALTSHAPDVGTSWTQLINNGNTMYIYKGIFIYLGVQNNATDKGTLYQANGTYSTADYEVTCVNVYAGGDTNYTKSLAARIQDASNMYLLRYSENVFEIYKEVAGVWTRLGLETSSYPKGKTSAPYIGDTVGLKVVGNQISGSINGTTVLTVTDGDISAAGVAGFGIGAVSVATDDSGTGITAGTFTVSSVTTNYTLTYTAGANGSITGSSPQTVASGSSGSAVTAVADTGYRFVQWDDGSTDNPRTDTNVTANHTYTASFAVTDTDPPILSNITPFTSSSGAIITWDTSENASSLVNYGLTSSCSLATAESDTAPRTGSHSITISGLVPCTRYYYKAQSTDGYTNTGYSSVGTFKTTGCTGDANITATGQSTATKAGGGTVNQGDITLTIPTSFKTSVDTATFQINKLDSNNFLGEAGSPSGKNQVGTDVYTLKALADETTAVSSFDSPITVTMAYSESDIVAIDESSLWIYRYDGSSWHALNNCVVNISAKNVTCTTENFSDFAIFGEQKTYQPSGGTVMPPNEVKKMVEQAKIEELKALIVALQNQIGSLTVDTLAPKFNRDLYLGVSGEDVKQLQIYLNSHGFVVAQTEEGSPGNETEFFGQGTKAALIKFQQANYIFPFFGFLGPVTREFLNKY